MRSTIFRPSIGIVGFGAFGRLMARHLAPHLAVCAYDPAWPDAAAESAVVTRGTFAEAVLQDIVIFAVPVERLPSVAAASAPLLRLGTLVLDVGSVKVEPAAVMLRTLPDHVDILATHPLFGPQSARDGLAGHTIVLCPVRGSRTKLVSRFLRETLGLAVEVTTPDAHDRDLATVQGVTHLVSRLLAGIGPVPARLTTQSFDRLMQAVAMVADDAPEVFDAILLRNPHAATVRNRFFAAAAHLERTLGQPVGGASNRSLTDPSPCSATLPAWSSAPESAPSWCP